MPMHPDEVTWITDEVAITNFFSAHDPETLTGHQVRAVLCLDRELQGNAATERGVESIRTIHLVDGRNEMAIFRRAVENLEELVKKHHRVIVHCRAGRSRSIAVVAAYLRMARNMEADDALAFVMERRQAAIAPELVRLVEEFEA